MRRFPFSALLIAAGLLSAPAVWAHGIETSVERLGSLSEGLDLGPKVRSSGFTMPSAGSRITASTKGRLSLVSRFSSGLPASDATVRLVPPDGGLPIELGHTDREGHLTFTLPPRAREGWELQVDAGPGHRDYLDLSELGSGGQARRPGLPSAGALLAWTPLLALAGMVAARGLRRRS